VIFLMIANLLAKNGLLRVHFARGQITFSICRDRGPANSYNSIQI